MESIGGTGDGCVNVLLKRMSMKPIQCDSYRAVMKWRFRIEMIF